MTAPPTTSANTPPPRSPARRRRTRVPLLLAVAAGALAIPAPARGARALSEQPEASPEEAPPARADEAPPPRADDAPPAAPDAPPSLDFDLLGEAKPPPEAADAASLRRRRTMLTWHQGIGLGLLGLQLGTTVAGHLNYNDKYNGGPQTDRYRSTHKALAYTTLAVFATTGLVALLAPSPKTPKKLDRVMVHRIAMGVATAGMATQVGLGLYTRERVGYQDQERLATAHLAVGYVTLAALLVGVGALIL